MKKVLVAVVVALACSPTMVQASVIVSVESTTLGYSALDQTGWLYVYLQSTESPQPGLMSYDVRINLSGASGITFVGQQKAPGAGSRGYLLPSGTWFTSTLDSATQITVADMSLSGGDTVVDGRGFIQFQYKVAGGTVGVGDITVDTGYTDMYKPDYSAISFTTQNGKITVTPEPGTLVLLCSGGVAIALLGLRRRMRKGL